MKNIVRVWIGDPYDKGHFNGTAFFIDEHTLVTAKHVVLNSQNEIYQDIYLTNTPDGGVTPIDDVVLCKRDMVVLKVKKAFNIEAVSFSDELSVGENVNVVGFYDNSSSQKSYSNRVSGYQNGEHTYELQNYLTHGLSGSPVFLNGDICGVTKAINSTKNITYVIPISELCVELQESKKEDNEPHEVFGDAPFTGLITKALERNLKLQDTVDKLEAELKTSSKPEEQLELSVRLDEVRKEKDKKDVEIKSLNEFIENSNLKVVRKATEISEEKGLEATLKYFNGKKFTEFEKNTQSNMEELAGGYLFQAKALQLDNQYEPVKEAYKKALKYDRTADTLLDYVYFLERSHYFDEAINMYEQLLPEQRALAKTNPSAVATTLNRLGYRYWYKYKEPLKKQLQKAEEAFDEALKIRMVLAKTNAKVYNPYVAETLENLGRLYKTKNQILKAKEAYKKALTYDQSYASLVNYAGFLESQNYIDEAAEIYKQMLQERRNLAKNDPDAYTNDVISALFDLASLYGDAGQLQKAKEAYSELLEITKAQVKANPGFHEFSLAYVLALGVDILNLPSTNLDEAEVILQKYKGKNNVKDALYYIERVRKQ